MKENLLPKKSYNISKVEELNVKSFAAPFKKSLGETIAIKGALVTTHIDDKGEERNSSYIVTDDNKIYGGVSATVAESIYNAIALMEEGVKLNVTFSSFVSNSGREFIIATFSEHE